MGFGGIGPWQLLIILVIVILIFGTKRLKTLGGDLGGALKSFRKAMESSDEDESKSSGEGEQRRIAAEDDDDDQDAKFSEQKEEKQHRG